MNKIIDDSNLNMPPSEGTENKSVLEGVVLEGDQFKYKTQDQQSQQPTEEQPPFQDESSDVISHVDGSTQITLSFDQLMQLLSKTEPPARPDFLREHTPAQPPEVQPKHTEPMGEAGTRVIYQSDDFETGEQKRTFVSYDDDNFLNDEQVSADTINNIRRNHAQAAYTPVGTRDGRFAVSEIEFDSSSLPELKGRRINPPAISSARGNIPVMTTAGPTRVRRMGSVEIEEAEYTEIGSAADEEEKSEKKPKKKTGGEIVRRVILIIALIAIIASGAYLIREYVLHKENQKYEEEISNMIIDVPTTEETTTKKNKKKDKKKDNKKETTTTSQAEKTIEEQWDEVRRQYPNVSFPLGLQLKYAKLYASNRYFVGYLEAPGTRLSLPIVQTGERDEENTYLKKNFYGANTKYGCPFVSSFNSISAGYLDYNTVIFGHHMNDNTIFGALDVYKTLNGFKNAPIINFNTLYNDYQWKVIAAIITNDNPKDDNGYKFEYSFTSLSNDTYKQTYLNELAKRSLYDTGVDVTVNDRLLTLSTCSHEFDDARFVVVARMVRAGESSEVDVSKAFENNSPRFPQAYYDAKKRDNPYIGDNNWYGE